MNKQKNNITFVNMKPCNFSYNNHRLLEILIHVIGWGIVFGFPFFFFSRTNSHFSWSDYLHHVIVPLSFLIVFYVNYLLLTPRFLFCQQTKRYIIYNIILIILMGTALYLWQALNLSPLPKEPHPRPPFPGWVFFARDMLSMIFVAGLGAAIRMSINWSHAEAARREAEKSKTEAELKNLKNQLNPHFLLNTLNNIYALIAFDKDKAQQAVQELSKLLRYVLYDNQQTYVPLYKEADFIKNYIELMRIRLAAHVNVETNIHIRPDSPTLIAPLLFISLIENAFKHGISPTERSHIHIILTEEKANEVRCCISNSYFPKTQQDKSGSGIGLEQVSKRLELLYPGQYHWEKQVSPDKKEYFSLLTIHTQPENKPLNFDRL